MATKVNFIVITIYFVIYVGSSSFKGSSRVVGGYDAPYEFGRFHASLQNVTGSHVCGGAVISLSRAVTAAHCVVGADPMYIKVVVGTTNLDIGGQEFDVKSIDIHENYNYSLRTNDIAIVTIDGMFDTRTINVLEVDDISLTEDDPVILTGFGAQTPNGESSRVMYALNLSVFSQETCEYAMRYSRQVVDTMFCTFTQIGQGTCHGDSGGPLIKNNKLVGLVSWGIPCAVGFPDVHTRISSFADWIRSKIN
ncbi:chymotrypsin-1 isoform X2 [Amyelois transitella]|uniref:chymotrypsin-1 isoform X2 n=1 Tax=Amyelois transitella TaxID=680683 RepID=UPI00067C5D6A|nr:chymotrypsin-1 isoform X2 [Amyelois transitella]